MFEDEDNIISKSFQAAEHKQIVNLSHAKSIPR